MREATTAGRARGSDDPLLALIGRSPLFSVHWEGAEEIPTAKVRQLMVGCAERLRERGARNEPTVQWRTLPFSLLEVILP